MNTKAMFEKKQMLIAELEEILNVSEVENRSFNEAEQTKIAQLQEEIRAIDNKLQNKKVEERGKNNMVELRNLLVEGKEFIIENENQ